MPHFPLKPLLRQTGAPWGVASRCMLELHPTASTACLFVHGWGGDAETTWMGFPTQIRDSVRAEGTDFFFWDYDSIKTTAMFSAALLREFMQTLLDDPVASVLNPSLPTQRQREADFRYTRLLICAHSMGAVIARRAILDIEAATPGRFHPLQLRLLLFAPAHRGTDLVQLGKEILGGSFFGFPLSAITGGALVKLRSLRDLATGSPTLTDLERENKDARGRLTGLGCPDEILKARVLHAQNDDVVRQDNFDADPAFQPVVGHSHTTICKPSPQYRQPMLELEALL